MSVCPSVCLSVCSLLRYRLNVCLPPLPEVGCLKFLEIQNPWGKVMKRSGLTFDKQVNLARIRGLYNKDQKGLNKDPEVIQQGS